MGRSPIRSAALACRLITIASFALLPASSAQGPDDVAATMGPTDPAEVEAFFRGLIQSQMEEFHIAGAAVAVVRDGETLLLAGYGSADLQNGLRVDPETTLFRIASITKSFTATAVMQLVERGLVDLDADINDYLDFRIPATFDEPITLRHLLTHTAGFEDLLFDLLVIDADEMTPVREWLVTNMPARVRPPGQVPAYSNYGISIAGYVVERISGLSYGDYLRQHILEPLGMERTFVVPTERLAATETKGYTFAGGEFVETPHYLGQPGETPAGGLLSTASDMARYMNMHLQDGRLEGVEDGEAQVLSTETAQLMHSTQYSADPRLLGTALGLFDFSDNGQSTLGHSGDAYPISSLMLLLPDLDVGLFVVYNSDGAADLVNQHLGFQRAVFDHYFPRGAAVNPAAGTASSMAEAPPALITVDTSRLVGQYRMTRGSYTTFEKVGALFATVALTSPNDSTLEMSTPWGVFEFVAVDPLYFRQDGGPFGLAFRQGADGRAAYMFTDLTPMFGFQRLRWFETPTFNLALLAVCVAVLLSVLVVGLLRQLRARRGRHDSEEPRHEPLAPVEVGTTSQRRERVARWVLMAVAAVALTFVVGLMVWGDPMPLFGVSATFKVVLGIGVLAALLTIAAVIGAVFAWKDGFWSLPARLHYSSGTLAAVGFIWFLDNWNLLGWRF